MTHYQNDIRFGRVCLFTDLFTILDLPFNIARHVGRILQISMEIRVLRGEANFVRNRFGPESFVNFVVVRVFI